MKKKRKEGQTGREEGRKERRKEAKEMDRYQCGWGFPSPSPRFLHCFPWSWGLDSLIAAGTEWSFPSALQFIYWVQLDTSASASASASSIVTLTSIHKLHACLINFTIFGYTFSKGVEDRVVNPLKITWFNLYGSGVSSPFISCSHWKDHYRSPNAEKVGR